MLTRLFDKVWFFFFNFIFYFIFCWKEKEVQFINGGKPTSERMQAQSIKLEKRKNPIIKKRFKNIRSKQPNLTLGANQVLSKEAPGEKFAPAERFR